jgi:hypothetical protein
MPRRTGSITRGQGSPRASASWGRLRLEPGGTPPAGPTQVALPAHDAPRRDCPHGRRAEPLGHQQALGDGVRAEIAFLLQVRLYGV